VGGEKQHAQTKHHTMWIGNVRNLSFQDQLKATAAVGLNEMSMTPLDVDRNRAKGISPRDMRKMAEDLGISLPILDPMASWAPHWRSGISDPGFMEFLGYSADDFFRIADELGVSTMTVIGTLQPGLASMPEIAESFALLAVRAAAHGLRCILEFIPIWGRGRSCKSPTVRIPRWHSTFGTISGAGATTPCCAPFREAASPTCRSRTPKPSRRPGDRWRKIVCSIVCSPARALCRSKKCSTFSVKLAE
jgi:hypothetical protein